MIETPKPTDKSGAPLRPAAATGRLVISFDFNNSDPNEVRNLMERLKRRVYDDIWAYKQHEPMIVWHGVEIMNQSRK